ncbi:hypothetical protein [Aestuariimicrobium ganziense]|uniref:hypothetical protein n=1 Tax=Aestuariimicrobium ganziense TaxID=2773677 RepID=UPI001942BBD5|nr:hypothetical protein [Aestuariimicrobium ganziense]
MIRPGEIVDFYVHGDESLVLTGRQCLRLAPIATLIMQLIPCSRAELEAALVEQFGEPPAGELDSQLEALAEHGLLTLDADWGQAPSHS